MGNILIADAGASKTDWSLILENEECPFRTSTIGINPVNLSQDNIVELVAKLKESLPDVNLDFIYYFGAGCATQELIKKIENSFKKIWPLATVEVQSDLTGAAKALFDNEDGIVAILGTGSATGLFRNGEIISRIPSLGYILGDEGSGYALGKRLINAVFKQQLPDKVIRRFHEKYSLDTETLINKVYKETKPAQFIASFAPFLKENIESEYIQNLVMEEFDSFFVKNIFPYGNISNLRIGFAGSVAYVFSDFLEKITKKYGLNMVSVIKNPIPYLEKYYQK